MTLTALEYRWAEAAIGAIFPGSYDEGLAEITGMDVPGFLRQAMRHLPYRSALGVRMAIWMVAWAPFFVLGRFATIAGLALLDREALLARLAASRWYAVRSLVLVLKTMGAFLYAADTRVRARMQIPAPPRAPASSRAATVHGS